MVYSRNKRVVLLSIGRELLRGRTRDSDGPFLARRLTALGFEISQMIVVDDEEKAIGEELLRALRKKPALIFTTGGLGPTFDDMTLRSVAKALGLKLKLHRQALDQVRSYYREMHKKGVVGTAKIGPERRKMAMLPEGARPLPNPCGGAPGVEIERKNTTIFCLPGVPPEMKGIFRETLRPRLAKQARRGKEIDVAISTRDESRLVPFVKEIMSRFPGIYVKSRVAGAKERIRIVVTLHGGSEKNLLLAAEALRRRTRRL